MNKDMCLNSVDPENNGYLIVRGNVKYLMYMPASLEQ